MKCPKCQTENPESAKYCSGCATPLPFSDDIPVSATKTLEIPMKELEVGTTFARKYQILEQIGKGGMGVVYKALDNEVKEDIAIKILKPEIAQDESIIERFRNELKTARKISHKNVCRMYDLNKEEGTYYITLEYVPGRDLKDVIRREEKLSPEKAINIAKQVCEGLVEAHRLGIVHRDLKPQNIMIDEQGRAKIMDFGIARAVEAPGVTQTGVIIGTPDYISPEQAEGGAADQRSDIYSLGVILYEMVTGTVPFKGDTALSVALKHKAQIPRDPRKLNPGLSENLSRLILICMEKDRERRYQKAEELLADLQNIEEGFPLGTKIRPRQATFIQTLTRKKLFIPALIAVLAIIAVVIWQFLPQKEGVPSAPSGRPSLVVMYFENNTGDESLDHWRKALSDLMIADLSQSKYIYILPGDRLFKILNQLNQMEAKSYSSDVLKEVAARGVVDHTLQGNYVKAGENFRINIMLKNASTEELIGSDSVQGKGEESFFSLVDELTRRIKEHLKLSPEEIAGDIDMEVGKITTSSLEAYKYFSETEKFFYLGDYRKAIQLAEKAVAIDPEFAMAYYGMAWCYFQMGYRSEVVKYFQKAFELTNRLPDRERYLIQAEFYGQSENSYDKAIEMYTKLLEFYPEDWIANNNLGNLYEGLEYWEKARERYEVNVQNKVDNPYAYTNLSEVYMAEGLYDKAIEILENYLRNFPDHAFIHMYLAKIHLCQGEYGLAINEADKSCALAPSHYANFSLKGNIYYCSGDLIKAEIEYRKLLESKEPAANDFGRRSLKDLYLLQGRFEESKDQLEQGIELAIKLVEMRWESLNHFYLAYIYLKSGNPEESLEECNKSWRGAVEVNRLRNQIRALHLKGLTYIEMNSIDNAQRTALELKELIEKGMNRKAIRNYHHLMGMIELEKENFPKAIEYFKMALTSLPYQFYLWLYVTAEHALFIDSLALAYYKVGDLEKAREAYERIISLTTGRLHYGDIYAKSFYMLGKIYEQQGDTVKAIEHYEKFLNLWKDADPGIAEVDDAKRRLSSLGRADRYSGAK